MYITSTNLKSMVSWVVKSCRFIEVHRRVGEMYFLSLQVEE
jgi:hypothetical protein